MLYTFFATRTTLALQCTMFVFLLKGDAYCSVLRGGDRVGVKITSGAGVTKDIAGRLLLHTGAREVHVGSACHESVPCNSSQPTAVSLGPSDRGVQRPARLCDNMNRVSRVNLLGSQECYVSSLEAFLPFATLPLPWKLVSAIVESMVDDHCCLMFPASQVRPLALNESPNTWCRICYKRWRRELDVYGRQKPHDTDATTISGMFTCLHVYNVWGVGALLVRAYFAVSPLVMTVWCYPRLRQQHVTVVGVPRYLVFRSVLHMLSVHA